MLERRGETTVIIIGLYVLSETIVLNVYLDLNQTACVLPWSMHFNSTKSHQNFVCE